MPKSKTTKIIKYNNKRSKTCKVTQIPSSDKDIKAIIDSKVIKNNLEYLQKQAKTEIMPVLKADAYGHGLIGMSKIIRKLGVKHIGVATLGEAILLRKSGDKGRILAWLYDIDGEELKDAFELDIDIAIFDEKSIPKFISLIPKGKKIKVTMFVDTGINRAGISYDNAFDAFIEVNKCDKIELVGMMSHLVCSGIKNSPIVNEQLRKFRALRQRLETINIKPPLVHIANTDACINYDVSDFTIARSGCGIYGLVKNNKNIKLSMTLKSYLIQVKNIKKNQGIGYDWTYITPRNMSICILPIGYADIIPRLSSSKLYIYINGTKRKVLGTISMDQIVVESKKGDKVNDEAIIFGNGSNCPQTVFDLGKYSNLQPYEIICHIGNRINRVYK
jgi:alanine racemase